MARLGTLQQLGVDVYVPRRHLAQARPSPTPLQPRLPSSQRQQISRSAETARPAEIARLAPTSEVASPGRASRMLVTNEDEQYTAPKSAERAELPVRKSQRVPAGPVSFHLLTMAFNGGVLIISDLKAAPLRASLEASVLQFVTDIGFALDPDAERSEAPGYFNWPLARVPGADASAARARQVLAGYIDRQLREYRPAHLLLMGDNAADYVGNSLHLPDGRALNVLRAPALGQFFARPALKARLWELLQPISRHK